MNRSMMPRPSGFLLTLAFAGFISLGLPDAMMGVAWPSVRSTFQLRQGAIGIAMIVSGLGYLISSFLSGRLLNQVGIGLVLAGSTGLVAGSMYGFAWAPTWPLFLLSALIHGLGSGAIDSGLNGYAAHRLSTRHLIWLHACYCFGALTGPIVMSWYLSTGRHYSAGYIAVGTVMLTLATVFLFACRIWGDSSPEDATIQVPTGIQETLRNPTVRLLMIVFFLYTGLEVTLSQWTYTVLTESRGLRPGLAGAIVGAYWGCIGIGRIISGLLAERVGVDRLLRVSLLVAVTGGLLFTSRLGVSMTALSIAMAGLGLSPVFPGLMSRTPSRLGPQLSANAVGFQVGSAMIGAAAVPGVLGILAGRISLEAVPVGKCFLLALLFTLHEWLCRGSDVSATAIATGSGGHERSSIEGTR